MLTISSGDISFSKDFLLSFVLDTKFVHFVFGYSSPKYLCINLSSLYQKTLSISSYRSHLTALISVPSPTFVSMSNSSINRFTPGSPAPSPPDVEYPSSITLRTSGIPGPSSVATTRRPFFLHDLISQYRFDPYPHIGKYYELIQKWRL